MTNVQFETGGKRAVASLVTRLRPASTDCSPVVHLPRSTYRHLGNALQASCLPRSQAPASGGAEHGEAGASKTNASPSWSLGTRGYAWERGRKYSHGPAIAGSPRHALLGDPAPAPRQRGRLQHHSTTPSLQHRPPNPFDKLRAGSEPRTKNQEPETRNQKPQTSRPAAERAGVS